MLRWSLAVLAVVLVAVGGLVWLRSSPWFAVQRVILPPLETVSAADVRRAVSPATGRNLLALSTAELEARLRALPYVREAHVYRRFPDAVEVELREYRAVAQVKGAEGRRWLVAADGRILGRAEKDSHQLLVVPEEQTWPRPGEHLAAEVTAGLALAPLLDQAAVWPEPGRVSHLVVRRDGRLVLVLAEGGEIRLGEPSTLKQKLMVAWAYVDPKSSYHTRFLYLDVSVQSRPVVREKGA